MEPISRRKDIVSGPKRCDNNLDMKKRLQTLVLFVTGNLCFSAEAYTLDVSTTGITLRGGSAQGVFYGLQSLRQLIVAGRRTITTVSIVDKPCFRYRGGMFNFGRYFWTVDEVKEFINPLVSRKYVVPIRANFFEKIISKNDAWMTMLKVKFLSVLFKIHFRKVSHIDLRVDL